MAYLFLQELQVCSALVFDISFAFILVKVIRPRCILGLPCSLIVIVIIIVFVEREIALFRGFFPVYITLVSRLTLSGTPFLLFKAAGSV